MSWSILCVVSGVARGLALLRRLGTLGSDVVSATGRTIGFARQLASDPEPSAPLRRVSLIASAASDELLLACFQQFHATIDDDNFARNLDESRELADYLEERRLLGDPTSWHLASGAAVLSESTRRVGHISFTHATYTSPYTPEATVPGASRYVEHTRNETVHAWLMRQERPAPWLVCVHGAGMGDPFADMLVFRANSMHAAGFNIAVPVLPHHGPRGAGRFTMAFPNEDPAMNLHGATQAIADVRALLAYIAARGERAVLFGLSLGGYVAATVAALEPGLAGVVVGVPVVDIADLMRTHTPERFAQHPRYEDFFGLAVRLDPVTSPLGLPRADRARSANLGRACRSPRPSGPGGTSHPTLGHAGGVVVPGRASRLLWRTGSPSMRGRHVGRVGHRDPEQGATGRRLKRPGASLITYAI